MFEIKQFIINLRTLLGYPNLSDSEWKKLVRDHVENKKSKKHISYWEQRKNSNPISHCEVWISFSLALNLLNRYLKDKILVIMCCEDTFSIKMVDTKLHYYLNKEEEETFIFSFDLLSQMNIPVDKFIESIDEAICNIIANESK